MIDRYQSVAAHGSARIVRSCGFDSIPSDIGVWFLQREARKQYEQVCGEIKLLVKAMKGGASGRTFANMMNALETTIPATAQPAKCSAKALSVLPGTSWRPGTVSGRRLRHG